MKGKHPVSHWIDMGQETLLVVPHTEADVGSPLMQHLPIYSPSTPAPSLCCQGKRIYIRFAELAEFHQELLFTFVSEMTKTTKCVLGVQFSRKVDKAFTFKLS